MPLMKNETDQPTTYDAFHVKAQNAHAAAVAASERPDRMWGGTPQAEWEGQHYAYLMAASILAGDQSEGFRPAVPAHLSNKEVTV